MGKVECIQYQRYDFWFHSSDHAPPHFHCAKTSEWEIRIFFLDCSRENGLIYEVKWGKEHRNKILKILNELVVKNKVELLQEWEEKVKIYS